MRRSFVAHNSAGVCEQELLALVDAAKNGDRLKLREKLFGLSPAAAGSLVSHPWALNGHAAAYTNGHAADTTSDQQIHMALT